MNGDDMISASRAAKLRGGIHPETVRRWCRKGWIACVKAGGHWKVSKSEVLAFDPPRPGPKRKGVEE